MTASAIRACDGWCAAPAAARKDDGAERVAGPAAEPVAAGGAERMRPGRPTA